MLVQNIENVLTDLAELCFDLLAIFLDECDLLLVPLGLFLLLDRGHDAPGGTTGTDHVLVSDREQVSLLHREFLIRSCNGLHVLHHFYANVS